MSEIRDDKLIRSTFMLIRFVIQMVMALKIMMIRMT